MIALDKHAKAMIRHAAGDMNAEGIANLEEAVALRLHRMTDGGFGLSVNHVRSAISQELSRDKSQKRNPELPPPVDAGRGAGRSRAQRSAVRNVRPTTRTPGEAA